MYGYGIPNYNLQSNNQNVMLNSIDKQIETQEGRLNELKQMRSQIMQPQPSINQTFQLTPSQVGIKMVDNISDVEKEQIFNDTPFFSKDMSILWVKNIKGEIKAYSLEEIVKQDERDIEIEYLKNELEKYKKGKENNEKCSNSNGNEPIKEQRPSSISNSSKSKQG